jgi:hypothetical protein
MTFVVFGAGDQVGRALDEDPSPSRRLLNWALDCGKISRIFAIGRPDWRVSLSRVVASLEEAGT